ncbi:hypothetical protein D3C71_1813980 [compost metagenome]
MVHRQRLAVSLFQIGLECGEVGFTLRRRRFFVKTAQHQRTGVFDLHKRHQLLMHHGTQVVRVLLDLRLFGFQTGEGLLSRVLHQAVRIGLIDRIS